MSNTYEQLLLTDKSGLEVKITNLIKEQLNNNEGAGRELNLIANTIDYYVEIAETCSFEVEYPLLTATKIFGSVEDFQEREHYATAEDAEFKGGISWDADTNEGYFSWDDCPSVSVEVLGLTEDASDEARNLWEAQREAEERQERLDWKRKRLEQAQKELLKLQAELTAAEATT